MTTTITYHPSLNRQDHHYVVLVTAIQHVRREDSKLARFLAFRAYEPNERTVMSATMRLPRGCLALGYEEPTGTFKLRLCGHGGQPMDTGIQGTQLAVRIRHWLTLGGVALPETNKAAADE